jgi:hypothetical protein
MVHFNITTYLPTCIDLHGSWPLFKIGASFEMHLQNYKMAFISRILVFDSPVSRSMVHGFNISHPCSVLASSGTPKDRVSNTPYYESWIVCRVLHAGRYRYLAFGTCQILCSTTFCILYACTSIKSMYIVHVWKCRFGISTPRDVFNPFAMVPVIGRTPRKNVVYGARDYTSTVVPNNKRYARGSKRM